MSTKNIIDNLIEGIKFYVNEKLKIAPYDKTDTAIVVGVSEFGYNVKYNGKIYSDVNTIGGICSINESVKILIPQNNLNNMFIVKGSTNHDIIDVQNEINQLELNKLDKTGDSSNTTVTFTESATRENIISGEKLSVLFGKIKKWFTDLKAVAFSGLASDLTQDSTHRLVTDTEKSDWNSKAPQNHASINTTYGIGTSTNYGHVKLSDNYTSSSGDADSGIGASSKNVYDLYNYTNTNFSNKLFNNIDLYVSTTGSDVTGNGTPENPFKTIQHTINFVPKDLGGYTATINISNGIYNEDILVSGFGTSGSVKMLLAGNVTINDFRISGSYIIIDSSTIDNRSFTMKSLTITDGSNFNAWSAIYITTTGNYSDATLGSNYSIVIGRGSVAYVSGVTTITGNTGTGLSIHSVSRAYFYSLNGSGLNIGIDLRTGSQLTYFSNSLSATTPTQLFTGGMIISSNGTQIWAPASSIGCTWGTTYGTYYRHGNLNGVAQVIVQLRVTTTIALTAGNYYYITGFPAPILQAFTSIAVTTSVQSETKSSVLDALGRITFSPHNNQPIGFTLTFSCTYITNS